MSHVNINLPAALAFLLSALATSADAARGFLDDSTASTFRAHGALMLIAWGFLLPLGAIIALYRRHFSKSFFPWHRALQVTGFVLSSIAFILAIKGINDAYGAYAEKKGQPLSDYSWNYKGYNTPANCEKAKTAEQAGEFLCTGPHVRMGFFIVGLSTLQVILGVTHHQIKKRFDAKSDDNKVWKRPVLPSYFHVYLGWTILALAYLQMYWGLQYFNHIAAKDDDNAMWKCRYIVIIFGAIFGILLLVEQALRWKAHGFNPCGLKHGMVLFPETPSASNGEKGVNP